MNRRRRNLLTAAGLLMLAVAALLVAAAPPWLERQIASRARQALERTFGCPARVAAVDLRVLQSTVTLSDLRVECSAGQSMELPRLEAVLRPAALLGGRVVVSRLTLDAPRLHWLVNGADPEGDVPAPVAAEDPAPGTPVMVEQLALRGGRLHLGLPAMDAQVSIDDLTAHSPQLWDGRNLALKVRAGDATWDGGDRQLKNLELSANLDWQAAHGLMLKQMVLAAAGGARLQGEATIQPLAGAADYRFDGEARLPPDFLAQLNVLPEGVRLAQPLAWRGAVIGEAGDWRVNGSLQGASLEVSGLPLQDWRLDNGQFSAAGGLQADFAAATLNGSLRGRVNAAAQGSSWRLSGESTLQDLDLSQLPSSLLPAGMPAPSSLLSGGVAGELPLDDPLAVQAQVNATLEPPDGIPSVAMLAPGATVQAELSRRRVRLQQADTVMGELEASLQGAAGFDGAWDLGGQVVSHDLAATARRVQAWSGWSLPAMQGRLALEGQWRGGSAPPHLSGQLQAGELVVATLPLGTLQARLSWSEGALHLLEGRLSGPLGDAEGHGAWQPGAERASSARLRLQRLGLQPLLSLLVPSVRAAGEMTGHGDLRWEGEHMQAVVDVSGEGLAIADLKLDHVQLQAALDGTGLHFHDTFLQRREGRLALTGHVPWRHGDDQSADPAAEGASLRLDVRGFPLDDLWPGDDFSGALYARGDLQAALSPPSVRGQVDLGLVEMTLRDWSLPPIDGRMLLDQESMAIAFQSTQPRAALHATLSYEDPMPFAIEAEGGAVSLQGSGDLEGLVLHLDGIAVAAGGALHAPERFEGQLQVAGLALDTPAGQVVTEAPLVVRGHGTTMVLAPLKLLLDEDALSLYGQAQLSPQPAYRLQLSGTSNLSNWSAFKGGSLELGGKALLDLEVVGHTGPPVLVGDLEIRDGYVRDPEVFPNSLEQITANAHLENGQLQLQSLTGRMGGGRVSASGHAELEGTHLGAYRLQLISEGVATRYPRGVRTVSDAQVTLSGEGDQATLRGRVELLHGRYTEDFRIESRLLTRTAPRLPPPPGPLDDLRLDLEVVAPGQFWIDNDFARAEFRADMHLGGTATRPVTSGLVELNRSGRLMFRDVEYDIEEASLSFSPAFPNDPTMDILARTQVSTYTVNLEVGGRISQPTMALSSDPDLAEDEIVMLLLTGGLWDNPQQPETQSLAFTGYLGGAFLTGTAIERLTGIDQARIDPVFVEGQGDPTARLTLTERLSDRLTASWSTTLGEAQGNTAELRYRVLPHLEVRTAQEETGASVIEGRYVRSFPSRMQRRQRLEGPPAPSGRRLGRRLLLGDVTLEGAPDAPGRPAVRQALALTPGEEVDSGAILRGAAAARALLLKEGYLMARVDCQSAEGTAGQPVKVHCLVQAGPLIGLQLEGARGRRERRDLVPVIQEEWLEVMRQEDLPRAAAAAARRWYRARGHAGAEAEADFAAGPDGTRLVRVLLEPGPRVRATRVMLEGLEGLDEDDVRRHLVLAGRAGLRHVLVTPRALADDQETLVRLYAGSGYLDVQVSEPELDWQSRDEVTVIYRVQAGRQRRVNQVEFEGVSGFAMEEIYASFAPELGRPPDPRQLEETVVALQAHYDAHGYAEAAVLWRLERSGEGGVIVRFRIQEGPQLQVRQVFIDGLVVTREAIVRRELEVEPGEPFRHSLLLKNQRRVRDLGIFRSVVVRGEEVAGEPGLRDLVIEVKERNNLDLAAGLGFDNDEGIRASFSLGNRNYLGRGGTLSFQGRISGDLLSGELRNGWRRVGGSRNDFLGALSIRQQVRQGFSEERESVVLQMARPVNRRTILQARYRIENFSLYDLETFLPAERQVNEAFVDEGRLGSVGVSWVRKTFDNPLLPGEGALRTIDLSVYASELGSDFDYARFFLQQGRVFSFRQERFGYLVSGRLGFMWPFADTVRVPLAERFFVGGISSVRGYRQDRLGPVNPTTGEPIGGESLLVINNEVKMRMKGGLHARLFLDIGNTFVRAQDIELDDLKYTAGPGLSYDTPVGPLRLYYGFKLNREPEEERGRFHITFGAVF